MVYKSSYIMINITYEQCYNEAKKYKTLKEFSDKKPHYCSFAYSKGWINNFILGYFLRV